MAKTFVDLNGDGNNDKAFSFPSYQVSDVKVEVDNVVKTATTHYNITSYTTTGGGTVVFTSGNIPTSGQSIRIYRDTDIDTSAGEYDPKAIYAAGSSVKADDLNNNQKQALYAIAEEKDQTIQTQDIKDGAVTRVKIDADAIDGTKIADDSINSEHYVAASIDNEHLADDAVGADELAANAVVNASVAAGAAIEFTKLENLDGGKILVGNGSNKATEVDMSGDVTINNTGATTITANAVQIGNISDTETTLTANSDAKIPTSKAVADHVVDVVNSVGGFVIVPDKDNFPASHPDPNNDAGTVLSITNPNGLTVSSNTSSNGTRTGGSSTVTINNIPTDAGSTLTANYTMLVQTTSTEHTYDFYKFLAKDGDVLSLSNDIDDFAARYRVAASAPVTGLCAANGAGTGSYPCDGDMYWNTGSNKMYVFGAPAASTSTSDLQAAWAEVTSTGEFKILTVVPDGATSGAPVFNNSNVSFDLRDGSNAANITNVAQLTVILNGVQQKPNTGTWSSSNEGFHLEGANGIKFCTAPPTDSSPNIFVILSGSAVSIPTPGDGTVTEAKLNANAPSNGQLLTADSTAGSGFKWADAPANVGGANGVDFNDGVKTRYGTSNEFVIEHDGANSWLNNTGGGNLYIRTGGASSHSDIHISSNNQGTVVTGASFHGGGSVALNHNGSKKVETTGSGIDVTGGVSATGTISTSGSIYSIGPGSTASGTDAGLLTSTGVVLSATNAGPCDIRFLGNTANAYVGFKSAGSSLTSGTTIWTLPSADGSANQALTTNGSAVLSWSDVSSTVANDAIYINDDEITADYTVAAGKGAHSVGPITLTGCTVTVNGRWVIS